MTTTDFFATAATRRFTSAASRALAEAAAETGSGNAGSDGIGNVGALSNAGATSWQNNMTISTYNTSSLTAGATVTAIVFSAKKNNANPSSPFTLEAGWATADAWHTKAQVAALTQTGATIATGSLNTSTLTALGTVTNFSGLSLTGNTYVHWGSGAWRTGGTLPGGANSVGICAVSAQVGSAVDPKMSVTYTVSTNYTVSVGLHGTPTIGTTTRLGGIAAAGVAPHGTVSAAAVGAFQLAAGTAVTTHGTLGAAIIRGQFPTAALLGQGTVGTAALVQSFIAAAAIGALGTVGATPHMQGLASATVAALATVGATPHMLARAAAAIATHGTLTTALQRDSALVAALVGQGNIGAAALGALLATAAVTGHGTIATALQRDSALVAALSALGTLGSTTHLDAKAASSLTAHGTVGAASPSLKQRVTAALHALATVGALKPRIGGTIAINGFSDGTAHLASTSRANLEAGTGTKTNDNSGTALAVGAAGDSATWTNDEAFVRFDMSSLPTGAIIGSARLRVHGVFGYGSSGVPVRVYAFNAFTGTVGNAAYRSKSDLAGMTQVGSISYGSVVADTYNVITLTDLTTITGSVAGFVFADGKFVDGSTLPTSFGAGVDNAFHSQEYSAGNFPVYLDVTYTLPDNISVASALVAHALAATVGPGVMAAVASASVHGTPTIGATPHMQAILGAVGLTGASSVTSTAHLGQLIAAAIAGTGTLDLDEVLRIVPVVAAIAAHGMLGAAPHMQGLADADVVAHAVMSATPHMQGIAQADIIALADVLGAWATILVMAAIAGAADVDGAAIRNRFVAAGIWANSYLGTGVPFGEEGVRAGNQPHGQVVINGQPWYINVAEQREGRS